MTTPVLDELAKQYAFSDKMLKMISQDLGPEDWSATLGEANSAHWILGHLVGSRLYLLRKLGGEVEPEAWEGFFEASKEPQENEVARYPAPEALIEAFCALTPSLTQQLGSLDERADDAWGSEFPDGASTLAGGARFMFMHESYHLGQLGLLRRAHGKPGFV